MKLKNTALVAICCLVLSACKKGGSDDNSQPIHGTWKTQSITRNYTAPVVNQVDMFSNLAPCFQDNLLVIRANGTYEHNEGSTKCDPAFPQVTESGTFTLSHNNTRINYSSGYYADIMETPGATLKYKITSTGSGNQYFDVFVFTRQ